MMHTKLIDTVLQLKSGTVLFERRFTLPQICPILKGFKTRASKKNETNKDDDIDDYDKPIRFSTSKAAKFPAAYTAASHDKPACQSLVLTASLGIFMLYFFVLREENDIDEKMTKNIPQEVLEDIYGKERMKKS